MKSVFYAGAGIQSVLFFLNDGYLSATLACGSGVSPRTRECVLTAHQPPQWMLDEADYVTEMKCHRHPYQKGVPARKGIEY